jgi:hypothetical protein
MSVISRLTVAALVLAACVLVSVLQLTGREAETRSEVAAPKLADGPLARPTDEPVLRIEGVEGGNVTTDRTELDFKTIDALARESLTVHEPFLKRKMTFTGVNLGALLQRAGVSASARRIYMQALDDYHVELPWPALKQDALLATRAGGRPIAIADGGPIRVVFPDASELGAITDNWIWSVDRMAAR